MKSQPGEAWRSFYERGNVAWLRPGALTPESIGQLPSSEAIRRILALTRLDPNSRIRVLEAGCGTGMLAIGLAMLGFSVDAFDYNEGALEIARTLLAKVQSAGYIAQVRFYKGDITRIQAEPGSYDLVFNQSVLEYFVREEERRKAFEEMARAARSGAWVCAIVQHAGHPLRPLWELAGWPGYTNQPPLLSFTPARLREEMRACGLVDVAVDGLYAWKSVFFGWASLGNRAWLQNLANGLNRRLDRLLPLPRPLRSRMGLQILGVGRKAQM